MADTGAISAGAGASAAPGSITWTSPGNITAHDANKASVNTASFLLIQSEHLKATSFGFAIPSGATIDGVKVDVEASATIVSTAPVFETVQLLKAGSAAGDNKATGSLTASDAYYTFGGAADIWGTTLSSSDVNNSGFGVTVRFSLAGGGEDTEWVYVNHVRITVHYTAAGGTRDAMTAVQAVC